MDRVHAYGPDETNPSGHSNYSQQNSVKLEVPPGTKQMWLKLTIDVDKVSEFKFPAGVTNVEFGYIPSVMTHVNGSSRPEGDPTCNHSDHNGNSYIERNDDTMGGCGSTWERMCSHCGKVWRDGEYVN